MLILAAFAGINSDLFAENSSDEEVSDAVIENEDEDDFPVLP